MAPINVHPPDPDHPKGMAFIMGAGFVDPRNGKSFQDREPIALIQAWEPTSELWWDLGLRWHPELATKWIKGGGQFVVGDIVNERPVEPSLEESAEELLEFLGSEKPEFADEWINGGYFFFHREFLRYLSKDDSCVLERAPLVRLAADQQLAVYRNRGFWACMDTQRDLDYLNELWASGNAPWAVWEHR